MRDGWEIKKLGEVCEVNYGTRVVQKKDGGTIFPVYGGGGATFRMDTYNRKDCMIVARFAMSSQCVRFVKGKFFLNDSGLTLESKSNSIIQRFLDKQILALNDTIYSLGKGIAQKNLDVRALKQIDIKIPTSISEQERIVAELNLLSGIIEKKRQQLKELDNLAQSIFYDMFGDPITNEKGWEVACVVDVVKMQRGFDLPVQDRDSSGGIPVYGSNGIIARHNISRVDFGIITGRSGTIGEVYVSETPFWPLNTTLFSVDTHGNNVVYLQHLITNYHLERFKAGAGVPTLNRNDFHNKEIIKVPLPLQQSFAAKVEAIEKQKELVKQSLVETETLFNSRMDYYFSEE
ncbi:MAG: restriction endonuclease subunit S [Paraprevotella sp.]|nr:restriction endonuclease subunit S [Paraprevotella sp.]